ncbi:unnamed protein product [Trichobilharzia szidati]|nr:unnamed protein product [Trichobilharzia szidati]
MKATIWSYEVLVIMDFSKIPKELAHLNVFLRCATDHYTKDPTITYYCLLQAFQRGLSTNQKSPSIKVFLSSLMDKLEELKQNNSDREEVMNETIGIPYVEQYALRLFKAAYGKDMNGDFGPSTVKLFLTAATLLDVVSGVGEVGDDIEKARKYAKWKAVYISKCLKSGEVPVSGPIPDTDAACTPSITGLVGVDDLFNEKPSVPNENTPTIPDHTSGQPFTPESFSVSNHISSKQWLDVEKDIKYALSASNYQDRETTVKYLTQALKSLGVKL